MSKQIVTHHILFPLGETGTEWTYTHKNKNQVSNHYGCHVCPTEEVHLGPVYLFPAW